MSGWREAAAPAKLNLALVVGPPRRDGKHEVVTVLERLSLADSVAVRLAPTTRVSGFEEDTLVRAALDAVSEAAPGKPRFEARIEKRIPVAAGLGGGSSDAGTALVLANGLLETPLPADALEEIAAALGADVPFFLRDGCQLGTADGTALEPIVLPRDYWVVLALPGRVVKASTAAVYEAFDARGGERGFGARRAALWAGLERVERAADLGMLPPNDLAASPLTERLESLGAFRADVTGAGPAVYGLFEAPGDARSAAVGLEPDATTWIAQPA